MINILKYKSTTFYAAETSNFVLIINWLRIGNVPYISCYKMYIFNSYRFKLPNIRSRFDPFIKVQLKYKKKKVIVSIDIHDFKKNVLFNETNIM